MGLSHQAKTLCHFRISEIEEDLEEEGNTLQAESRDEIKQKVKIDSVTSGLKTLRLKREYVKMQTNGNHAFASEAARDSFYMKFKMRIIVPAITLYHKGGSKGGLSTEYLLKDLNAIGAMESEYMQGFLQPEFTRMGKNSFEKCKQIVIQNEFCRSFTQKILTSAREYFDNLTDERIGRLFRSSENIEVSSVTGNPDLVFKISSQDYSIKSEIFNEFLDDLYQASADYVLRNIN